MVVVDGAEGLLRCLVRRNLSELNREALTGWGMMGLPGVVYGSRTFKGVNKVPSKPGSE